MNNPDQDILIRALEDARRVLGEYIEPDREMRRERWSGCWLYSIGATLFTHLIE
jgi:hypothetical protein